MAPDLQHPTDPLTPDEIDGETRRLRLRLATARRRVEHTAPADDAETEHIARCASDLDHADSQLDLVEATVATDPSAATGALLSAMGTIDRVIEHLPTSPTDHQLLAQRQPHSPEIRLGALVTESRPGESRAEAVLYALFRGVGWVLGGVLSRGIGGGGRY